MTDRIREEQWAEESLRLAGSPRGLALGIDIGGTGIKGGLVDLDAGWLTGERHYIPTPQPATPEAVAEQ
jgi:polyphosphate glucokinase